MPSARHGAEGRSSSAPGRWRNVIDNVDGKLDVDVAAAHTRVSRIVARSRRQRIRRHRNLPTSPATSRSTAVSAAQPLTLCAAEGPHGRRLGRCVHAETSRSRGPMWIGRRALSGLRRRAALETGSGADRCERARAARRCEHRSRLRRRHAPMPAATSASVTSRRAWRHRPPTSRQAVAHRESAALRWHIGTGKAGSGSNPDPATCG